MRKIALLLLALALLALLVWFALSGDEDSGAQNGIREGTAAAARAADGDGAAKRADTSRSRDQRAGAGEDPTLSAYLRTAKELGQDKPQDPKLGAISGRVMRGAADPVKECFVEAYALGQPAVRVRVRSGPTFLLKNVPVGGGIGLAVRADGYAPGGMEKLIVSAGETLDVGTIYLGMAIDPDVDNQVRVEVRAADTATTPSAGPVAGATVTATSVSYRTLITLGNLEKAPGATILRAQTDPSGVASFEMLPPGKWDFFCESEGYAFQVEEQFLVQRATKTTVKMELTAGMSISGTVVSEDQKPVAGARIVSMRWGSFTNVPTVTTDAEGKFIVPGLTAGNYLLVAAKEDLGGKEMQQIPAGKTDLSIVLPPGSDLWIKCVDAATELPIAEFGVRPYRKMPFAYLYSPLFEAKSEDGVFKTKVMPASDYGIEVTAPGYALNNVASIPAQMTEALEVRLNPAGVIRGQVVGKTSGAPIRGASIYVKRGGFPPSKVKDQQTVSDASGMFTLSNLSRTPIAITIAHVDHDEAAFAGVVPTAVSDEPAEPRKFQLSDGGRVSGKVLLAGGIATAGQKLTLIKGFDFTTIRSATTDGQGVYAFENVPPAEKYTLAVGDFNPQRPGRSKGDVAVREGETTVVDFGGDTGGVTVTGRVRKAEQGVGGYSLTLLSSDGGSFQANARTLDDGTFSFEHVPTGKYLLRAGQGSSSKTRDLAVVEGTPPAEVVIDLTAGGTLSGVVTDRATNQPIAGVWVQCQLVTESTGGGLADLVKRNRGERTTAAEGTFSFAELEDGTYSVRLYRDGYGTEVRDDLVIKGGQSRGDVAMTMGAACTLTGFVRDSRGTPIEGAALQFRDSAGRQVFGISFAGSEGDGRYTQGALKAETYDVSVQKEGYAPATQRVTMTVGAAVTADFTLYLGGKIEVVVRGADGAAVADATVVLLDASGQPLTKIVTFQNILSLAGLKTDSTGILVVSGLAPGAYGVRVTPKTSTTSVDRMGVEVIDGAMARVEVSVNLN